MMPTQRMLEKLLVDPISLDSRTNWVIDPYVDARIGSTSNKNGKEISHFLKAYAAKSPEDSAYYRRLSTLPKPNTDRRSVILDIGCGPYDCISALPGRHIFLDDILDAYRDKLGATHDGLRICARTELMPLSEGSIDVVYSINMIDHVDDMPETVREIHRVMKPGGKLYLQTYFNSHPLLETEPGVFDRFFFDTFVRPLFDVDHVQTYARGDPAISNSYTMDIFCAVLTAKGVETPSGKDRHRYNRENYLGPQSLISQAISELKADNPVDAMLHTLEGESCYDIHLGLLRAWSMVVRGDHGEANIALKNMVSHDRVRTNAYARIALMTIENRRIAKAAALAREVA